MKVLTSLIALLLLCVSAYTQDLTGFNPPGGGGSIDTATLFPTKITGGGIANYMPRFTGLRIIDTTSWTWDGKAWNTGLLRIGFGIGGALGAIASTSTPQNGITFRDANAGLNLTSLGSLTIATSVSNAGTNSSSITPTWGYGVGIYHATTYGGNTAGEYPALTINHSIGKVLRFVWNNLATLPVSHFDFRLASTKHGFIMISRSPNGRDSLLFAIKADSTRPTIMGVDTSGVVGDTTWHGQATIGTGDSVVVWASGARATDAFQSVSVAYYGNALFAPTRIPQAACWKDNTVTLYADVTKKVSWIIIRK